MNKPTIKREVTVANVFIVKGLSPYIAFYATRDAVEDLKEFGVLKPWSGVDNKYYLTVDPRFDFDEVLAYIESYG